MRFHRHTNPCHDIRKPRRGEQVTLNPPGFVVKPIPGVSRYRLELSRDRSFPAGQTIQAEFGPWTVWIPEEPLSPGRWYWRWFAGDRASQVWYFDIAGDALVEAVPGRVELAGRAGPHPRIIFTEKNLQHLRNTTDAVLRDDLARLRRLADACLGKSHDMPEPPWLPQRGKDQETHLRIWRAAMNDSRTFAMGAACLALAWLIWRDERYAKAATSRLLSLARWDPDGATSIRHNDEPHMSVIQRATVAYDWLYEIMPEPQRRAVREHLERRLHNTYRHLRHELNFGIERITSHATRMLGFLGFGGLSLLGECDEAAEWLDYVLRIMVALWPIWGGQDGGWAQGVPYSSPYVAWACESAYGLYTGLGFNVYGHAFFRNHLLWRTLCLPVYAEQSAFGDAAERPPANIPDHYACLEHLRRMFRCEQLVPVSESLRRKVLQANPDYFSWLLLVTEPPAGLPEVTELPEAAAFRDVGWVAFRRNLAQGSDDIALLMKSSPYASISHSHADQNAFVLHAFGKSLAIASGYYDAYGTLHHHCWTRQTKAVNAITLAGAGQRISDPSASGRIEAFQRRRRYAYACARAAPAYVGRLSRADRHVVFADSRYFVIVDDLESPVEESFWWHLHSFDPMQFDEAAKQVLIDRDGVRLFVQLVYPDQMTFLQHNRFDVPPLPRDGADYPPQWHFTAIPVPIRRSDLFAAILIPLRPDEPPPQVQVSERDGCVAASVRFDAAAWPADFAGREDVWLFGRPDRNLLTWQGVTAEGLFGWFRKDKRIGLWKRRR